MSREQSKTIAGHAAQSEAQGAALRRDGFHAARMERSRFRLDLRRSLKMHRRMALGIALFGTVLSTAYLVRYWPVYSAETRIYIQPAPVGETSEGVAKHWPYSYDPAAYESYVQQQMLSMTEPDVLKGAAATLQSFGRSGESEADVAAQLSRAIEVARVGNSYEVAIRAHAESAQMAADMANAAAASYIENTAHEQKAGDAVRIAILLEQAALVKKQLDDDRAARAAPQESAQKQSGDMSEETARLQNRLYALDEQIQNLDIESAAGETAHVATKAIAPSYPVADGVVPNTAIMLAAFLLLAIVAAVVASRLDPKLYLSSDVEQILDFAPIAELPDLNEVSVEVFEEQLLRLASAVEAAFVHGDLRSCVFTGVAEGVGVSTIAERMRSLLEGMSRPAALVDATGKQPAVWPSNRVAVAQELRDVRPLMLIRRVAEEAWRDDIAVLADAAPLAISAETEILVRNADCVIVVLESGVTSRSQLRALAKALQRLDVQAAGYVLNRVSMVNAGAAFRELLAAIEKQMREQNRNAAKEPARTRRMEFQATRQPIPDPARNEEASAPPMAVAASSGEPKSVAPSSAAQPVAENVGAKAKFEQPVLWTQRTTHQEPLVQPSSFIRARKEEAGRRLPWWLPDPITQPEVPVQEAKEPEQLSAEEVEPAVPEPRLSSLRRLFADKGAIFAGGAPVPAPAKTSADPRVLKTEQPNARNVPERAASGREVRTEPSAANRKATPEITALPEFLPPRTTREAKLDEDAASRRERRDTWDDVAVLPSWRGQYRRKE